MGSCSPAFRNAAKCMFNQQGEAEVNGPLLVGANTSAVLALAQRKQLAIGDLSELRARLEQFTKLRARLEQFTKLKGNQLRGSQVLTPPWALQSEMGGSM